jgi:hypothetical protein
MKQLETDREKIVQKHIENQFNNQFTYQTNSQFNNLTLETTIITTLTYKKAPDLLINNEDAEMEIQELIEYLIQTIILEHVWINVL